MIPHLHVMPGIGDSGWMFQKLQGHFEAMDITVCDYGPRRSEDYLRLLGCREISYSKKWTPDQLYRLALPHNVNLNKLDYNTAQHITVNGWLEQGNRIEDWHPEYPTKYLLDFNTSARDKLKALGYLNQHKEDEAKRIVLYTSSAKNNKAVNFLDHADWANIVISMRNLWGKDTVIILVGAEYDRDCTNKLSRWMATTTQIRCINAVGCDIGCTIELMKNADGVVSYPSGIGITASFVGTPCLMWMFPSIRKMHYTWIDPEVQEQNHFVQHCISDKRDIIKHLAELRFKGD